MTGYTVQVKRLRNQDPLSALVFQGAKRKRDEDDSGDENPSSADDPQFIFRLAETYDTQQKHILLQRFGVESSGNKFRVVNSNKNRKTAASKEDEIPEQLQSMIAEYLKSEQPQKSPNIPDSNEIDKETEDYVYDVYYTERAGPLTSSSDIGYIEADETERKLIFGKIDSDDDSDFIPDDEDDSNAEDYYKNDYPDEEDSEGGSILSPFASDQDSLTDALGESGRAPFQEDAWSEADEDEEYERYGWRRG